MSVWKTVFMLWVIASSVLLLGIILGWWVPD